jgi:hypothetical protein
VDCRRAAASTLAVGLLVAALARVLIPMAPPLYDGVIPVGPYVWVDPPQGEPGGAEGATATVDVKDARSPLLAVATPELVPQAQLFAEPGGITLPASAQSIHVSIEPVRPTTAPKEGHVVGNVYRIGVTDQDGKPLSAPASAQVSVVLRSADPNLLYGVIGEFTDAGWHELATSPPGFGGTFVAVVTDFGDFAVIAPGAPPTTSTSTIQPGSPTNRASGGVLLSPAVTAEPTIEPSRSPAGSDLGWIVPAGVVLVVGIVLAALGMASRGRRRRRYRGAHPINRR